MKSATKWMVVPFNPNYKKLTIEDALGAVLKKQNLDSFSKVKEYQQILNKNISESHPIITEEKKEYQSESSSAGLSNLSPYNDTSPTFSQEKNINFSHYREPAKLELSSEDEENMDISLNQTQNSNPPPSKIDVSSFIKKTNHNRKKRKNRREVSFLNNTITRNTDRVTRAKRFLLKKGFIVRPNYDDEEENSSPKRKVKIIERKWESFKP